MTPTSRTLDYFRKRGDDPAVVERFIPGKPFGHRKDMFGFGDVVVMSDSIIAVQSCGQSFAAHRRKILEDPDVAKRALRWLQCQGPPRLILMGWRKVKKKRGGKQMVWKPRILEFTQEDFKGVP